MLFVKECKKVICSLTFVVYVVTVVVMYVTQFTDVLDNPVLPPQKGLNYYGSIAKEVPEILMPAAAEGLVSEYLADSYVAYPLGIYKRVKLGESDKEKMADIVEELTGISPEELNEFEEYEAGGYSQVMDENGNSTVEYREAVLPEINFPTDMSYDRFKELMARADKIIGGGSKYSEKYIVGNFSQIPMTYEDALAEYEELMQEDSIAEGYIRLFCDYLGIVLAIMPVFVCVALWQMDRKAQAEQLIYSRKVSTVKLVGTRYLALVISMALPVLLPFLHALAGICMLYPDKDIAFGKAAGLAALWLLPCIFIVVGVGALISELVSPLFAIFVQGVWWYMTLEMNQLTGSITKWSLILRHNTLGKGRLWASEYGDFVWNRTAYLILSVAAVGITMFVYEKKRKGAYYAQGTLWKHHSRKSKA